MVGNGTEEGRSVTTATLAEVKSVFGLADVGNKEPFSFSTVPSVPPDARAAKRGN